MRFLIYSFGMILISMMATSMQETQDIHAYEKEHCKRNKRPHYIAH